MFFDRFLTEFIFSFSCHFILLCQFEFLKERLKAIERGSNHRLEDDGRLCLVPDVIIPPKFKIPEFEKYKGHLVSQELSDNVL